MNYFVWMVSLLWIAVSLSAQSQSVDRRQKLESLEKRYREQQQTLDSLHRTLDRLGQEKNEYTKEVTQRLLQEASTQETESVAAGYEDGFFVRSADGEFEFKFSGFAQWGAGLFENRTFDNNGFFVNGVYLFFDFQLTKNIHAHVEANVAATGFVNQFQEGNGVGIEVYDAYLEYQFTTEFNVLLGNVWTPFSMNGGNYSNELITIWYEPFIYAWDLGNNVGLMLYGTLDDTFEYCFGLYNGAGNMAVNDDDGFLFSGVFRYHYLGYEKNPNNYFHVGVMRSRNSPDGSNNADAVLYSPWGRQVYDGTVNNAHATKYGSAVVEESTTRGWKTGVDTAFRFDRTFDNGSNLRVEGEFIFMSFERDLTTGRLPYLHGFGAMFTIAYRHCFDKELEGSGLIPAFAFSYSDLDNKDTDDVGPGVGAPANIRGQRIYNYTLGLGYAFHKHVRVNFNWVMMNLENRNVNPPKDRPDGSGGLEHAWFFQMTTSW